jgi:hypothetical protein
LSQEHKHGISYQQRAYGSHPNQSNELFLFFLWSWSFQADFLGINFILSRDKQRIYQLYQLQCKVLKAEAQEQGFSQTY